MGTAIVWVDRRRDMCITNDSAARDQCDPRRSQRDRSIETHVTEMTRPGFDVRLLNEATTTLLGYFAFKFLVTSPEEFERDIDSAGHAGDAANQETR